MIWKEAQAQLRQIHSDVWNGVRFFLTINAIILASFFSVLKDYLSTPSIWSTFMVFTLLIIGVLVTIAARQILLKHRKSYLEMLIRKTLIEEDIGFGRMIIFSTHLRFPWFIDDENELNFIRRDPKEWIRKQTREKSTVTSRLFIVYEVLMFFYGILLLLQLINLIER